MDYAEHHANALLAEGGSLHEPELLGHGYERVSLAAARKNFSILAWQDRFGGWHYPTWQFDAKFSVRPDVVEILRLFRSRDSLYVISNVVFPLDSKYSLLDLIRSGKGGEAVTRVRAKLAEERSFEDLSPSQLAELKRRMKDFEDQTRYIVVSSLFRRAVSVYDISRNVYCHGQVEDGCLVKDRRIANAIAKQLRGKRKNFDLAVIAVRKTAKGYRALEDIRGVRGQKSWRPKFKTLDNTPVFVPIVPPDTRAGAVDAMLFAARHRKWLIEKLAGCEDRVVSKKLLLQKCKLTERQADAVLEMRLWSLTKVFVKELEQELRDEVARGS